MIFEFEKMALTPKDLDCEETQFYIKDFLVSEAITMIYGPPSQGKTWFMLGISKLLSATVSKIFYVDFDNPKRQLKERGVQWLIENYTNIKYFTKGGLKVTSTEFLKELKNNAFGRNYKDCTFIFDSTGDFVDNIHNDTQAKAFMETMKDIRDAGGTVLLIHHATKNGKVIDGSGEFAKSADNIYEFKQKAKIGSQLQWNLKVENDRDAICDCGFSVDTDTLTLKEMDPLLSSMNDYEEEFVKKATEGLKKNPSGLGETELLAYIGHPKTDKTARAVLEKFVDKFWLMTQEKKGRPKTYNLK